MPADEHISNEQFFHGTISPLKVGDTVEPANKTSWRKPRFPNETHPDYAYATDESTAWHYAELGWHNASGSPSHPKVFQVEPLGEHEPDPHYDEGGRLRDNFSADRRSKAGWRVTGEVPMPEHMGKPEEWR
jgi:hypothetical protein